MSRRLFPFLLVLAAALVGLPLLGVTLAGQDLAPYLAFPPRTPTAPPSSFSMPVFIALGILIIACLAPLVYRVLRFQGPAGGRVSRHRALPWWGLGGAVVVIVSWLLAWTRFEWFSELQAYTFTPLWLGYVLLVNGLTFRRTGRCMVRDQPGYFLLLFPLSSVFWWFFEFLNRFVQNWHYVGGAELGPWQYFWQATLPFSTVLPAVLGTRDYLSSFPSLGAGLAQAWPVRSRAPRAVAGVTLLGSACVLGCIGIWPHWLYPFLWVAPLSVLTSLQALTGQRTIFAELSRGDWRKLWYAALAALVCGFLWELWNHRSLAHWEYSVAYVHRFEIFEMPLLGYAGYLPFGLQCLAAASLLQPSPHYS